MPFQKGHKKIAGRQKGSKTKLQLSLTVLETLQELGHDPIRGMVDLAIDPETSPELRGKMNAELAKYVYPQRKAIEHSGPGGSAITIDLLDKIAADARRRRENPSGD